jgi:sugar O-acyltransferase (sialic acid O-acetyltransferase NeuD family)
MSKQSFDSKNKIILQGGGEHARVVLDCLLTQKADVVALFDPKYSGFLFGIPQRGEYDPTYHPDAHLIVAIGDNKTRKKVVEKSRHKFTNAIHPSVLFSLFSTMGTGNMLLHGAIIQAQTSIGNHVIVNTGAQIDHDCIIKDYVHVGPGAVLSGSVSIGEGTFIGAGAVVIPGIKVGAWATIGAGTVVINDIPDYAVAVGNPARIIKHHVL